jgi:hypothetical protein
METLDVRNITTGKDGQVFVTLSDGNQMFLAEAEAFGIQLNVNNTDHQPIGSALVYAINTGYTVTVTLTETIVRDDVTLTKFYDDLKNGYMPTFDFQGKIKRRDGQAQRQVVRSCIPDGTVDLLNIQPGEILKRNWSFRANATPELIAYFKK